VKFTALLFTLGLLLLSCNETKEKQESISDIVEETHEFAMNYKSFGEKISDENIITIDQMMAKYKVMKKGDTTHVKFKAEVNSVCQKMGCWMRLGMGEMESLVKFKDYGFFMPKDIAGQDVIVQGKAFVEHTSIEDLKHMAEEAGKSQKEIDAITDTEISYSFISEGVLLVENQ
jgi:Domain of unknown function (DUF4920)